MLESVNPKKSPISLDSLAFESYVGCTTGTFSGNVTLTCNGQAEGFGLSYTGNYFNVYLIAGNSYVFDDGFAGSRYITIANTTGTAVLAAGTNSVTYTPTTSNAEQR